MSSTPKRTVKSGSSDMRAEYDFDYSKAKPNRFAEKLTGSVVTVVLDPDVASVFGSSAEVNTLLRSVISAMPDPKRVSRPKTHRRKAG